jgi:hypothetical protein
MLDESLKQPVAGRPLCSPSTPLDSPRRDCSLSDYRRFISAQGMQIVEDEGCYWVEKRNHFWESAPSHRRVSLSPAMAIKLFALGAFAIRYTCPDNVGTPTFEYVWDDKQYGLGSLHKDAKRNVRKNMAVCSFRPVQFELLAREGCAINRDVYARQHRQPDFQTNQSKWKAYIETCATLPFVEAYGIFHREKLCGYSLVLFVDDYCYTFHPYAHSDYLKFCPMNVLIYSLVQDVLQRPGVSCISYGVESYTPRPTLERFKIAMGCRKRILQRRIVVHPLLRPAFTNPGIWLIQKILRHAKPRIAEQFSIFASAVRDIPDNSTAHSESE